MIRLIRCRVTVGAPFAGTHLMDDIMGASIETIRGNATRMEFGFFDPTGAVLDLSAVSSINLKLQPSQTVAGVLADKTLVASALDLTLTTATWAARTHQHAVFALTNAEANIGATPPAGPKAGYWLVLTAILTDGSEVTLCGGTLTVHEDNNETSGSPPDNPGTGITLEQADARYALAGSDGGGAGLTWVELTQAAYDALTSTQRNDVTKIYDISDFTW